jgi:hypothetical protein
MTVDGTKISRLGETSGMEDGDLEMAPFSPIFFSFSKTSPEAHACQQSLRTTDRPSKHQHRQHHP